MVHLDQRNALKEEGQICNISVVYGQMANKTFPYLVYSRICDRIESDIMNNLDM